MHPALHALLTLTALLAIGAGAWAILAALVAAILPGVALPGHRPATPFSPITLAIVLTIGLAIFLAGASGLGQLAVSP